MKNINEIKEKPELPIKQMEYTQNIEEMKLLIEILEEQMKSCPSYEIIFNLI